MIYEAKSATIEIMVVVSEVSDFSNPYNSAKFLPETVQISYEDSAEKGWVFKRVRLEGPRVRKDGSASEARSRHSIYDNMHHPGELPDEAPAWLVHLVEKVRPERSVWR